MGRIREKEQRRRGKEVDAAEEPRVGTIDGQADGTGVIDAAAALAKAEPATSTTTSIALDNKKEEELRVAEEAGERCMRMDRFGGADGEVFTFCFQGEMIFKPGFIGFPERSPQELLSNHFYRCEKRNKIELDVTDCECSMIDPLGNKMVCQCKLPPCAVSAFKQLQTQQTIHKRNMSALKTTIDQVQAAMSNPKAAVESVLTLHTRSGTLQDDVRRWLLCRTHSAINM